MAAIHCVARIFSGEKLLRNFIAGFALAGGRLNLPLYGESVVFVTRREMFVHGTLRGAEAKLVSFGNVWKLFGIDKNFGIFQMAQKHR